MKERREFIKITPSKAEEFLQHNLPQNRVIRTLVVDKYAKDMKNGLWNERVSIDQDPIIISDDNFLINGQHRCKAIIKSGCTINSMVVFGADKEIYKYLDNGAVRSAKDYISHKNANAMAAQAKILFCLEQGETPLISSAQGHLDSGKPPAQPSRNDIVDTAEKNEEYLDQIIKMGWKLGSPFSSKNGAFQTALMIIDFVGNGDRIEDFVDDFSQPASDFKTNSAIKTYMSQCYGNKKYKTDQKWIMSCIFAAYDCFREGKVLKCFNKPSLYLSRYDKLLKEERERRKNERN